MSVSVRLRSIGVAVAATLASALAVWWLLWLYLLGPIGYSAPERFEYSDEPYQVFVYGTLKQPWVRRFIIGRTVDVTADTLTGYARDGLDLVAAPEASTTGLRFEVSANEMQRLDRYERLGVRYQRKQVVLDSGSQAWVYRRIAVD
ncbi:MAG: gamma-glutamylcyclotransferase [Alkalimonas sp.]|nr:gamma-glutamylcyclotransferase [Alkalimonas sp.]